MKKYVMGNWKSNGTTEMIHAFREAMPQLTEAAGNNANLGLALPYHLLIQGNKMEGMATGGQQVSRFPEGAYTGEITGNMLKASGCNFCLVGHSERRQYFHETVADTGERIGRLIDTGLLPVLCIGETLEQRQAGQLTEVLSEQLGPLDALDGNTELVVAYEPVWAIGTGVAATPEDVAGAHANIKEMLAKKGFSNDTAILYGGSVKGANAAELAAIDNVDGFLVGGASLKPQDFLAIIKGFVSQS